ncbi:MAG: hypothetical protein CBARDCOR_2179 [uncultured Caballeronia sp.]|nr:MAG: hypothetical protein CBARDCOR_2179 [uncultured Caballeronia sp.]
MTNCSGLDRPPAPFDDSSCCPRVCGFSANNAYKFGGYIIHGHFSYNVPKSEANIKARGLSFEAVGDFALSCRVP